MKNREYLFLRQSRKIGFKKKLFACMLLGAITLGDTMAQNVKRITLQLENAQFIIRKSKFPQNPKRSVRFSGKRTKRSVQKRKARNTQKAETKVL